MNTLYLKRIFFYILGCYSPAMHAKDLDVAFGQNRPPFIINQQGDLQGIEIDIVTEALAYKGHTIKSKTPMPNARLAVAVTKMSYDAAAGVQVSDQQSFYSQSFISYSNIAISKKKDQISLSSTAQLRHYSVVAWQNAYKNLDKIFKHYYSPQSPLRGELDYIEFANQQAQNAFFWKGRAQIIVVDTVIFHWFKKTLADQFSTFEPVVYHDIFKTTTDYQVSFSDTQLRDDFNQGLADLKKTGRYQAIIQRYTYAPKTSIQSK